MNDQTHVVEITISAAYPHGGKERASVSISGDGGLEHMMEAFKTALVAAGFSMALAAKIDDLDI